MRGKGEAAKIKGPGGSRGARVPCFVLHCQACDVNLERLFWGQITDAEVFYQSVEASR